MNLVPYVTSSADLPAIYERATQALAELQRVADAKKWADKMQALAFYAKRLGDEPLRIMAQRIQLRAMRRSEEILREYPIGDGNPNLPGPREVVTRRYMAIEEAKLSKWQYEATQIIGKLSDEEFESIVESDDPPTVNALIQWIVRPAAMPHVFHNAGQSEWYTPSEYIQAALRVLGHIDLDPASCPKANEVVQAQTIYTTEDSGLEHEWRGTVWMNPPYSSSLVQRFAEKLAHHFSKGDVPAAIVLVNNATETEWFQLLASLTAAMCFPRGRVKFWHPERVSAPLQGQAVLYLGTKRELFTSSFDGFGFVVETVCR